MEPLHALFIDHSWTHGTNIDQYTYPGERGSR